MSPMNPTHATVAHFKIGFGPICGNPRPIRMTEDPTLVTCKRCRRAMDRMLAQVLDKTR